MRVTCLIVMAYCGVTCCVACSTAHLGGVPSYKPPNSLDPEVLQLKKQLSLFEARYDNEIFQLRKDNAESKKEHNSMVQKFRSLQEIQEKLDESLQYERSPYSTAKCANAVFEYARKGNEWAKAVFGFLYMGNKTLRSTNICASTSSML
jgi:hypothetical protein